MTVAESLDNTVMVHVINAPEGARTVEKDAFVFLDAESARDLGLHLLRLAGAARQRQSNGSEVQR